MNPPRVAVVVWLVMIAAVTCAQERETMPPKLTRPRIFITPSDLPRIRVMAKDRRENALGFVPADQWKIIQAQADRFLAAPTYSYSVGIPKAGGGRFPQWSYTLSKNPPPPHKYAPSYPPWTAMFQDQRKDSITTRLRYLLVAYVVTEEDKYFQRAKKIVMALCAWPIVWTDPDYARGRPCLDTGHAATWVGIFYDWCYAALTPEERLVVREALAEKAVQPIHKMIGSVPAYHNYNAVVACGLGVGGIALLGEDKRAEAWVRRAVDQAKKYCDQQGEDGGAMEGPGYGDYAANSLSDLLWALMTAKVPNELYEHNYIETLPRYCISLLDPNTLTQPTFGDGGPTRGFGRLMLPIALTGDTDAAWYCQQIGALTPSSPRQFIAVDAARIKPVLPKLNPSDCFTDIGYAILRDGYNKDSAFLALKAGPPKKNIGHNHYDHNSFQINYAGAWVASDPGYKNYYIPEARKYTISSFGHNTIILDLDSDYLKNNNPTVPGHDQQYKHKGRIREFFTSDACDYVLGDAAAAYNPEKKTVVSRFHRQIVLVKPNIFFIRDTLAAPQPHTWSFLLHVPASGAFELAKNPSAAEAVVGRARMQAHVYSPDGIAITSRTHPKSQPYGSYLAATTGKTKATVITSVLAPRRSGLVLVNPGFEKGMNGWSPRNLPGILEHHVIDKQEKHSGEASARIDGNGYYYSAKISLPVGTKITAKFWAKTTAPERTFSLLHFWKGGKYAGKNKKGPYVKDNTWRQYSFSTVMPKGVEQVSLALQLEGKVDSGKCWFDEVELVLADQEYTAVDPAEIAPIEDGRAGAVCKVGDVTYVFLCGKAGRQRTLSAAGHQFATDAELAVVRLGKNPTAVFLLRGDTVLVDGKKAKAVNGMWRLPRK